MNEIRWEEWPLEFRIQILDQSLERCHARAQSIREEFHVIAATGEYDDDKRRVLNRELVKVGNYISAIQLLKNGIRQKEKERAERVRRINAVQQRGEESANSI